MNTVALFYHDDGWEIIILRHVSGGKFEEFICTLNVPNISNVMLVDGIDWNEVKYLKISGRMLDVGIVKGELVTVRECCYFPDIRVKYNSDMRKDWYINERSDVYEKEWTTWNWCWPTRHKDRFIKGNYYFSKKMPDKSVVIRLNGNVKLVEHQGEWSG